MIVSDEAERKLKASMKGGFAPFFTFCPISCSEGVEPFNASFRGFFPSSE